MGGRAVAGAEDNRSLGEERARRRTLDDYRREVDAEFGLPAGAPGAWRGSEVEEGVDRQPSIDEDEAVFRRSKRLRTERRRSAVRRMRRGRYIIGGVIGFLAGQIAVLGYLHILIHKGPAPSTAGIAAPVVSVPSLPPQGSNPSAPQPALVRTFETSTTGKPMSIGASEIPAAPPASSAKAVPPSDTTLVPPPTIPAREAPAVQPVQQPKVRSAPSGPPPRAAVSALPSESRAPILVSEEWAHSQAALRVALGEWLVRAGFGESVVGERSFPSAPTARRREHRSP